MVQSQELVRVKKNLIEAITTLCKKGLSYETEFCIEGLLGITLDNKDILLVNIKENVRSGDIKFDIKPSVCSSLDCDVSAEANYNDMVSVPVSIIPKRRKKRKSSNVSKRKIETVESPMSEYNKDSDSFTQDQSSAFQFSGDLHVPKTRQLSNHLDDIPSLDDSEYISLSYDGGVHDDREAHRNATSPHSNNILPKDDAYNHCNLQQSPRISLGGDEIPLDLGLHTDLPGSLSAVWDEPNMEMPMNLSENQIKQEIFQKKYHCKGCGKNYKTEQSMKKHRCKSGPNSISTETGGGCESTQQPLDLTVGRPDGAGGDFDMDAALLSIDHDDNDTELSLDDSLSSLEQYTCICSRAFNDYSVYVDHVANCHKAKLTPYKACETCGKYFFSNSGYVKHKRLHLGAYKFHCDVCHKGFFDRTHMRAHMDSSHSKVRRYECKHCNKSFFWKHHLKRHLGTCDQARMHSSLLEEAGSQSNSLQS